MHPTLITAILAFTGLAFSAALPGVSSHHGTVLYCSGPDACASMDINNYKCVTFGHQMTGLTLSDGLRCVLYQNQDCTNKFASSKGKVRKVEGNFDVATDARAKKNGVQGIGSISC
ncbi:hypothetical protein LTR17_023377 [Elasticomyces elasticus]|nr:hypothetical protein LTR17_023377 [Elasticomyces elasticus]